MITPAIILCLLIAPLIIGTILNRLAKRTVASPILLGCVGIALVFCFTSTGHFIQTGSMAEMLPPWVRGRILLVYVKGVIEIAAAPAVLIPRLRTMTGWALIIMLVLFLPVNIYAAVNRVGMGGHQWGPIYLLVRIPLQAILIGWTWWFAVRPATTGPIRFSCEASLGLPPETIHRPPSATDGENAVTGEHKTWHLGQQREVGRSSWLSRWFKYASQSTRR